MMRFIKKSKQLHTNNQGITMVELLIAVAMSTIIISVAAYFISSAIKNYNIASATINLQQESQVFLEQLSKWTMEADYAEVYDTSSGATVLMVYSIPEYFDSAKWPVGVTYHNVPGTTGTVRVIWQSGDNIYTKEYTVSPASQYEFNVAGSSYPCLPAADTINTFIGANTTRANIICEHVGTFTPTTSILNESPLPNVSDSNVTETINIELNMVSGLQEFKLEDQVLIRNELISQYKTLRARFAGIR